MKTAGKFVLFVVGLCLVAAAVGAGVYLGYWKRVPRNAGKNLEFRLVAVSTQVPAQPSAPTGDADAFSRDDADKFINSGDAPPGWKWLPVSDVAAESMRGNTSRGLQTESIVRTSGERMYLLVADSPDMTLTHGAGTPAWGVKTVTLDSSDGFGPAVKVTLNDAGGNLMRQFTQKYLGHSLAVVIGGQVSMNARIQDPLGNVFDVRFPIGRLHDAEELRDSLLQ